MKKPILVISSLLLISSPVWGVEPTESTYYITTPTPVESQDHSSSQTSSPESLGDVVDFFNGHLNSLDGFLNSGLSYLQGGFGELVGFIWGDSSLLRSLLGANSEIGSFLKDVNQLANLINRVAGYPQKMATWYRQAASVLSGELDLCTPGVSLTDSGTVVPSYVFEPGSCLGAITSSPNSQSNGAISSSPNSQNEGESSQDTVQGDAAVSMAEIINQSASDTALGIPDPMKLRTLVGQNIVAPTDGGDSFAINPVVANQYALNSAERFMWQQASLSVLGRYGQEKISEGMNGSFETIESGLKTAASAQNANSTQDVVKSVAEAQSQQTILLGTILNGQLVARTDDAMQLNALSNISRELDRQTKQEINEKNAVHRSLLRTYSQAGLY